MKKINESCHVDKDVKALIAAQRTEIIDFIGQALADKYNTNIGEFSKPNLIFALDGQQFAVSVVAREKAISLDEADATFTPEV